MSKMKDIITERQEIRRLKNRAMLREFFWATCLIFAFCVVLSFFEAEADESGVYFMVGPNWVESYSTEGIPVELELGYKGARLDLIGDPKWYARWYHASDFTGAIIGEAFGTEDDEYSINSVGVGLCWGAC